MGNIQMNDSLFAAFAELAHTLCGITIKSQRQTMLEGRLKRRLRALDLPGFKEYLDYIKLNRTEHQYFINAITTNETYFYRTPRVWNYIYDEYLPQWLSEHAGQTLNVWSAASSTGEEAHTLGIVLESFKSTETEFNYQIKGTDIDSSVIEIARHGIYNGRSVKRFREARPDLFEKYMTGDDETGYKVVSKIKRCMNFSMFNLFDRASEAAFDLVLIRNVLIYFVRDDQIKAMSQVHRSLKNDGVAIIGESESLNHVCSEFHQIMPTIYRKPGSTETSIAA